MWTDCLESNVSLRVLYKDTIPSLAQVEIHEISFLFDYSHIQLRLNLNELPQPMPAKWSKFNTVQITMILNDIEELTIQGWMPILKADINMQRIGPDKVKIEVIGEGMQMRAEAAPIYISNFAAYLKGVD